MDWMLTEEEKDRATEWLWKLDEYESGGYQAMRDDIIASTQARKLVGELQKIMVPWVEGTEYEGKVDYWGITNDEWQQLRKEVGL